VHGALSQALGGQSVEQLRVRVRADHEDDGLIEVDDGFGLAGVVGGHGGGVIGLAHTSATAFLIKPGESSSGANRDAPQADRMKMHGCQNTQFVGQGHAASRRGRCGFTLIEVLIVVVILGILAAIVIPRFSDSDDLTRTRVMAAGVRHVRELVLYHAASRDTALSAQGYPITLDTNWFRNGALPQHTWSGVPIVLDVVNGNPNDIYPGTKTYNPSTAGAATAWYNNANGAFCVLIPPQANDADTLQSFNDANLSTATSLSQTTE